MNRSRSSGAQPPIERALLQLLAHRFGDGLVYLRDDEERGLFEHAVRMGFISSEGYLTPAGRSLLAANNWE